MTITMYLNTAARRHAVEEAISRNLPRFTRRSSTFPVGIPAGGRHGSSSRQGALESHPSSMGTRPLSRTPSPKRRGISTLDEIESPILKRRGSGGTGNYSVRKISLEEAALSAHHTFPKTPDASSGMESPSVALFARRHPMQGLDLKRHKRLPPSRVLVMPSLATLSHSSSDPLTPVPELPPHHQDTREKH